jgi:hypothetical protein
VDTVGDRNSNAGVVLMVACAFDLDGLSVQKEPLIGVEPD